jgi:hypothetical protein
MTPYQINDLQRLCMFCGILLLLCTKVFNFDEVSLSIFSFVSCAFGIIFKKALSNPVP